MAAPDRSSERDGGVPMHASASVRNDRDAIVAMGERIVAAAAQAGFSEASCFAVRLAFEEALVNAFRHGHKGLPEDAPVEVEFDVTPQRITIAVEDAGPGFDPGAVPDPTAPENITKTSGRGLLLIRSYMTEVRHNKRGNRIELRYEKPAG